MQSTSLFGSKLKRSRTFLIGLGLIAVNMAILLPLGPFIHFLQGQSRGPAHGDEAASGRVGTPVERVLIRNDSLARFGDVARLPEASPLLRQPLGRTYGRLPLGFEANRGQVDDQVKFISRGNGYALFLTSTEAVIQLRIASAKQASPGIGLRNHDRPWSVVRGPSQPTTGNGQRTTDDSTVLRMKLVGANANSQVVGLEELPGKVNYFIGRDRAEWRTNIPVYARVKYEDVYSGVDVVYYGREQQLEYDFVVAPGADAGAIKLAFEGARNLRLDEQGDLVLATAGGEVRLSRPRIYQEVQGHRREIAGGYVLAPSGIEQVGFRLADYDASQPLIIDPVLTYSTFLGGSFVETGGGIAVDAAGNIYVTGHSISFDFPTTSPLQPKHAGGGNDVFVAKLDPTASMLVYSTYLGGRRDESGAGIAVDKAGNVYLTGSTASSDFPTENPIQSRFGGVYDAFVVALNAAGSEMIYSTYLGGSRDDAGADIALDASDNAYVTGQTRSQDFPISAVSFDNKCGSDGLCNGGFLSDAFVAKLDRLGAKLVYSTYLGGSAIDAGLGIAVDARGNIYVTGSTGSSDFPTLNPLQPTLGGVTDAFVTKLSSRGSLLSFSTFLGGSDEDVGAALALDSLGSSYVVGRTHSIDFPRRGGVQRSYGGGDYDAFVTKLNTRGSALSYSTYLGGRDEDFATGVALDGSGNAHIVGSTRSTNFPMKNPLQPVIGGEADVFVTRLDRTGRMVVYSTYLGGDSDEAATGVAVVSGEAYVTGDVSSSGFPTANALQPQYKGLRDAFILKIAP